MCCIPETSTRKVFIANCNKNNMKKKLCNWENVKGVCVCVYVKTKYEYGLCDL